MTNDDLSEKLNQNLTDVHSIEEQALVQLRRAPEMSGDADIAHDFETHEQETREQERSVRELLESRAAEPSTLKDLAGKVGGLGMAWFAESQPDSPTKLVAHAYSYEHLEVAAYELLRAVAERAGDEQAAQLARRIGAEERQMADRLQSRFRDAVEAVARELNAADRADQLDAYLSDAHAIEQQASQMLATAPALVEDEELRMLFQQHHEETQRHGELLEQRLDARNAGSSLLKDLALRVGGLNLGAFFKAQPDTDPKLAGFAFAFEHLEIAIYSMLAEMAELAGDSETREVAEEILGEERATADALGAMLEAILRRDYAGKDL